MKLVNIFATALVAFSAVVTYPTGSNAQSVSSVLADVQATCTGSPSDCAGAIAALNLRAVAPAAMAQLVQQLAAIAQQAAIANPAAAASIVNAVGRQAVVAAEVNPAAAAAVLTTTANITQAVAAAVPSVAAAMVQIVATTATNVAPSLSPAQRQTAAAEVQAVSVAAAGAGASPEISDIVASLATGNVPESAGSDFSLTGAVGASPT